MVCTTTDSAVCSPSMPGPGRVPLGVLVLRGVRGVVGGHHVDHALGERGPHGLGVRAGAQRRVDLVDRVVAGQARVGEQQVVRRDLGAHPHARPPWPPAARRSCARWRRGRRAARAPASRASAQSRATIVSSAVAGQPASPSRDGHLPLVRLRAPGEPVVLGVLGDHDVERGGVLQRPAHDQRIVHAAAVVGEHPHLRGRAGHRAELGHPLAAQADGDRADRVHVDEPDLGTAAAHVQRDDVGVDHRSRCWASRTRR